VGPKQVVAPFSTAPPPSADADDNDDNTVDITVVLLSPVEETRLVVHVAGVIDLATAPALAAGLDRAVADAMKRRALSEVVLDLRSVRFLSAAGLRELAGAHQRCWHDGIPLRVVADQRAVTIPLNLTGLDRPLGLRAGPDVPGTSP
jgi:anti-anti-sigma factor